MRVEMSSGVKPACQMLKAINTVPLRGLKVTDAAVRKYAMKRTIEHLYIF